MTAFPSVRQSGLLSATPGTQIPSIQNGVDHDPNEIISCLNTAQKMNVNLPLPSKKFLSPLGRELFLGNTAAACSSCSSSNNTNKKNCGFDAEQKLVAAPSRVHRLPETLVNSSLPTNFSVEGTMGNVSNDTLMNSAANQEDCSWEWDGLAENLYFEDLEILL